MNPTHDSKRRSWIAVSPDGPFPIQNLPFGVFLRRQQRGRDGDGLPAIGIAIGEFILDLRACQRAGILVPLPPEINEACAAESLNPLMALGAGSWSALRGFLSDLLRADHPEAALHQEILTPHLLNINDAVMVKPAMIGDYTDFYASSFHATNVGSLFRPDNPLLPNYKYVPIAYHGRASSIAVSGIAVRRPSGQILPVPGAPPQLARTRSLDYELEVGFFVGLGNRLGEPVSIERAEAHIFGVCLLNDWSARDIQAWEYQPLGPFLAKSFATTISPWLVSMEALAPFRAPAFARPAGDPPPLPYLFNDEDQQEGALDIRLEVLLSSAKMRAAHMAPIRVSASNTRALYWTPAQLLAHHTSNGCNLQTGDLLGSGTISGADRGSLGSLLEITRRGESPLTLPTGESRTFLEDGDEVTLRGYCEREGFARIGLGECSGIIAPG